MNWTVCLVKTKHSIQFFLKNGERKSNKLHGSTLSCFLLLLFVNYIFHMEVLYSYLLYPLPNVLGAWRTSNGKHLCWRGLVVFVTFSISIRTLFKQKSHIILGRLLSLHLWVWQVLSDIQIFAAGIETSIDLRRTGKWMKSLINQLHQLPNLLLLIYRINNVWVALNKYETWHQ